MKDKSKIRKRVLSAILAIVLLMTGVPFMGDERAEAASTDSFTLYSGIKLGKQSYSVGTVIYRPSGVVVTPYGSVETTAGLYNGATNERMYCIEVGKLAFDDLNSPPSRFKYNKAYTNAKVLAWFAYASNKGYSETQIQAGIWSLLGQIRANSTYQPAITAFNTAYSKDANNAIFKGAVGYEFVNAVHGSSRQRVVNFDFTPYYDLTLKKSAASGSSQTLSVAPKHYSLSGAVYRVYKTYADAQNKTNAVATLTTTASGSSNTVSLKKGTYYIREITAPKGFYLSNSILTVNLTANKTQTVSEVAKYDPLTIMLKKLGNDGKKLAGAEFTVKYYNDILTTDQAKAATPKKTWKFKTDANGALGLNQTYKIGGDTLYYDANSKPVGLIGTYTFVETKAPEGYRLPSDNFYIAYVKD